MSHMRYPRLSTIKSYQTSYLTTQKTGRPFIPTNTEEATVKDTIASPNR